MGRHAAAVTKTLLCRTQNIMQYLRQKNPSTQLILMATLPRADGETITNGVYNWPNKYTTGIASVNSGLTAYAAGQSNIHFVDCNTVLLPDGKVSWARMHMFLLCILVCSMH